METGSSFLLCSQIYINVMRIEIDSNKIGLNVFNFSTYKKQQGPRLTYSYTAPFLNSRYRTCSVSGLKSCTSSFFLQNRRTLALSLFAKYVLFFCGIIIQAIYGRTDAFLRNPNKKVNSPRYISFLVSCSRRKSRREAIPSEDLIEGPASATCSGKASSLNE